MKKTDVIVPAALQLVADDVGWMIGESRRWTEEPSRTGMPRKHVLEDYIALNEIGKLVGMKLNAMFVLGEWDKDNLLRTLPHATKEGENWDASKYLDIREAEKIRDYLNDCENIEIGVHGLLHNVFENGKVVGNQEYSIPEGFMKGGEPHFADETYIRSHLDVFFQIYRSWGFRQELRSFVCPGGPSNIGEFDRMAKILPDYGIHYWANHYWYGDLPEGDCAVFGDVIFNKKRIALAHWAAYDLDPDELGTYRAEDAGIVGGHWPNFLRFSPRHHLDNLDRWKAYFDRNAAVFGIMLSKDIAFAHHQQLLRAYSRVEDEGSAVAVELAGADAIYPAIRKEPVYISVLGAETPKCEGGEICVWDRQQDFTTYRVERTGGSRLLLHD